MCPRGRIAVHIFVSSKATLLEVEAWTHSHDKMLRVCQFAYHSSDVECRRKGDKDFTEEHRSEISKLYKAEVAHFKQYVDKMTDVDNKLQDIIHKVKEKNEEAAKKNEKDMNSWLPAWLTFGTKGEIGYNSHENMNHILETRSRWAKSTHRCLRCSKFILSAPQDPADEKQLSPPPTLPTTTKIKCLLT